MKIDLSIIRGVDKDLSKMRWCARSFGLCHNMEKSVVARGVESAGERDTLIEAGCDYLQGYLFVRQPRSKGRSESAYPGSRSQPGPLARAGG